MLLILAAKPVSAGEFRIDGIAIDVPARFEGPAFAQSDVNARSFVFTVQSNSLLSPSTVLQITALNPATDIEADRSGLVGQYLMQMLEGIERRRTNFQESPPNEIRLAGFPGSVVSWLGKANGIGTNGRMFCIAANSEIVFFHVMGGGITPNADMTAAIKALENARRY